MRQSMAWARGLVAGPAARRDGTSGRMQLRRADVAAGLPDDDRVIAACQGSANPALLEWVVQRLAASPEDRLLDVGAGLGGPTRWVQRRTGAVVLGLDAAPESVEGLQRLFPSVAVVQADARQLPLPPTSVDHVVALGLLDECGDPAGVIGEVARVLRPGGRLVATVRTCGGARAAASTAPGPHRVSDHLEALHDASFAQIALEDLSELPPPPDHWIRVGMAVEAAMSDHVEQGRQPRATVAWRRESFAEHDEADDENLQQCGIVATRAQWHGGRHAGC